MLFQLCFLFVKIRYILWFRLLSAMIFFGFFFFLCSSVPKINKENLSSPLMIFSFHVTSSFIYLRIKQLYLYFFVFCFPQFFFFSASCRTYKQISQLIKSKTFIVVWLNTEIGDIVLKLWIRTHFLEARKTS